MMMGALAMREKVIHLHPLVLRASHALLFLKARLKCKALTLAVSSSPLSLVMLRLLACHRRLSLLFPQVSEAQAAQLAAAEAASSAAPSDGVAADTAEHTN